MQFIFDHLLIIWKRSFYASLNCRNTSFNEMRQSRLPNIISASRGVAAIVMLFFSTFSVPFWFLYCWGGISDMIDGPIARKLHSVSELGSRIDSISDLIFVISSAIIVIPTFTLPLWIWLWIAGIGIIKTICIVCHSCRNHKFEIPHSKTNKLTGFLLFCLPFSLNWIGAVVPSIIVCTAASLSALEDVWNC